MPKKNYAYLSKAALIAAVLSTGVLVTPKAWAQG
jgi:hypothetical protein